ncbi:MAG: TIGR01212 family radical SAM protein [Oscillospiraceae bacterium]|nr:TIGR01212 family radical SAM protein [Oscillospiraceae bacterium]
MNKFEFSDTNKRYHTLSFYNKKVFGQKVFKASLSANLICPNIDGTKGFGGCGFCSSGSGNFVPNVSGIENQLKDEIERIDRKKNGAPVCAYFQAYTNTYADVDTLRSLYESALDNERVCALSIATRPDCIDEEKCVLLAEFAKKTKLTVELGLQTIFDETAMFFNRGYDFECFAKSLEMLKKHNIRVCVHIINGLPYETPDMMVQTTKTLSDLGIDAIKIQLLHILKNTRFEKLYLDGKIDVMDRELYIETVVRQLETLKPQIVVERLTGDGDAKELVAPLWSKNKISILNDIDKRMAKNNTYQGKIYG